jgi:hypothetical protein
VEFEADAHAVALIEAVVCRFGLQRPGVAAAGAAGDDTEVFALNANPWDERTAGRSAPGGAAATVWRSAAE